MSLRDNYGAELKSLDKLSIDLLSFLVCQVVKVRQIMFYYVYVLESIKNSSLYVGFTQDLRKRLLEHNRGLVFSTKPYKPWRIIHYEAYLDKRDAARREKYLKTNQSARLLRRMLKEYFYFKKTNK